MTSGIPSQSNRFRNRNYQKENKNLVTARLPKSLNDEIEKYKAENNMTDSEVIKLALKSLLISTP